MYYIVAIRYIWGPRLIDREKFVNPPKEYRGAPFWSINDILTSEEVKRQVALLDEGGYGGAFFHAREGLVTPFLSKEWFEAFSAAVEEAKKRGMYIWIYDELWWPSGFAGGLVPAKSSKYRAKALVLIIDNRAHEGDDIIAVFKCKVNEKEYPVTYEKASPGEASREYLYLNFVRYVAPLGETWFSGFCYVDLLDKETVAEFIKAAYEPYKQFKEEFGKTVPGVFTDEPNITASRPRAPTQIPPRGPRFPVYSLPWTDTLPEKFKELNGYDLLEKLPELFFDIGDYTKTRYDYWKTVTIMFLEAFSKQLYEWCDKHNLKFTGHYLAEDTLLSQMICNGALMPHYEYQHIPGIDHLGMEIWHTFLTVRQVASVANQLGRKRILCETYGCTGFGPSFEDRKWIGDWLVVQGVTLLNHHLVPYSLRGRRKKDYGLIFHWSQPWWKYNKIIELYFARLCYILSQGKREVNVLILHPISSAWILYSPLNSSKVVELDNEFKKLLKHMLKLHIDFDLGDEMILEKYGKVEDCKLKVGEAKYSVLIIPPSINISKSTLNLVKEFIEKGGTVIALPPLPKLVSGEPSKELEELLTKIKVVENLEKLSEALKNIEKPIVIEGDENGEVLYQLRRLEDNTLVLFLTNISREKTYSIKVGVAGSWKVEDWDLFTGKISEKICRLEENRTWVDLTLYPVNSKLLVFREGTPSYAIEKREVPVKVVELDKDWKIKRVDKNILVLDYCRYRVKGAWSPLIPVPKAHKELVSKGVGTKFALRFEFESEIDLADRKVFLAVENPKAFKAKVNGTEIELGKDGTWLDWNFGLTDISKLVGKGLNTVELEGEIGLEPELENIYILGDFAVKEKNGKYIITDEKEAVSSTEDLCKEGYPFYAGEIVLEKEFYLKLPEKKKIYIELEDLKAALAIVYLNGKKAGEVFLRPFKLDISDYIKNGYNKIKIVLVGTLRNAMGPLHHKEGDPTFISVSSFADETSWTDKYMLKPFGFKKAKILVCEETL